MKFTVHYYEIRSKPVTDGGLALGRISSSLTIAAAMIVAIVWTAAWERRRQRA